jgi:hypothetical protein
MKKLTIALTAAVLGCTSLHAQITFHGTIWTGAFWHATDQDDKDPTLGTYSMEGKHATRMALQGMVNGFDDPFGARFSIETYFTPSASQWTISRTSHPLYSGSYYGWVNMFDNKVRLMGGYIDNNNDFGPGGGADLSLMPESHNDEGDGDLSKGPGLFVRVKPWEEFTIGASAYMGARDAQPWEKAQFNFFASYFFDLMDVYSGLRTHKLANVNELHDTDAYMGLRLTKLVRRFGFGALSLDGFVYSLGEDFIRDEDSKGAAETGLYVVWNKNMLQVGGRAYTGFRFGDQTDTDTYTPNLNFWLYSSYRFPGLLTLQSVTVRLDTVYVKGTSPKTFTSYIPWEIASNQHNRHLASFYLKPSLELRPLGNCLISIGYFFIKDLSYYKVDPAYMNEHIVFVDFKVTW